MGQYHKLVNLDKKEQVISYPLGLGAKQYEQTGCQGSMADAMYLLMMTSPSRGGGDWQEFEGLSGRWVGDRVVVLGDYTEDSDLPFMENGGDLFGESESWIDISAEVGNALGQVWNFKLDTTDLWATRVQQ